MTENIINNSTAIVSLIVGTLGFLTAILTLIFSSRNNRRNYKLQEHKENRERSKSYNRVLGNLLKVYHSYIKHKHLYKDEGVQDFPDAVLVQFVDKIDNFEVEIVKFKKVVENESEIIPELTIYIHELLDLLSRFELLSEHIPINDSSIEKLVFKRAHNYAVSELLDEYFDDLILKLSQKADIEENFIETLKEFNSDDTICKTIKIQQKILKRMMESLSKQTGQNLEISDLINM